MIENDSRSRCSRELTLAFGSLAEALKTKDFEQVQELLAPEFVYVELDRDPVGRAAYLAAESGKADAYPTIEGHYHVLSAFEDQAEARAVVRGSFLVDTTRTGRTERFEGELLEHVHLRRQDGRYRFVHVHVFEMTMTVDGAPVVGFDDEGRPLTAAVAS